MTLGRDGIAGLIGLAVSLALLPFAFGLPKLPIVPVGPGFYPILVLSFMAGVSVVLVLQDIAARRSSAAVTSEGEAREPNRAYGAVAAAFAVTGAYVGLMPLLGFRIATAVFVAAFQMVLEMPRTPRQWAVLMAVAIGTAAVTHLVFEHYLLVLLPRGSWTNW